LGKEKMKIKPIRLFYYAVTAVFICISNLYSKIPAGYKGTPFHNDSIRELSARIPGKVQCECYDFGGMGVAYGGTKMKVNGLNAGAEFNRTQGCNEGGNPYLCTFRDTEAVPISYTKPCCDIDSLRNLYPQTLKQIYTGWTAPGEWLNYMVYVDTPGIYTINFLYTAPLPLGLEFSLALNNKTVVDRVQVPNSCKGDQADPLRWHRWNKLVNFAQIILPDTGLQLITFKATYSDPGEMNDLGNFDYIEFIRKGHETVKPEK
jgi:hypothetical protein